MKNPDDKIVKEPKKINKPNNNLQDLMDEKLWSIAETSRQTHLAEKTIKKMLSGEKTSRNSKIKVAKPFNVSAKEIFPNDPEL